MPQYSETVVTHAQWPLHRGQMESPTVIGVAGVPGRGGFVVLYLRIDEGRIADAMFQSEGCGPTIASGSVLTEMIIGTSLESCQSLRVDTLLNALGGLPVNKHHCAALAVNALRQAIADYQSAHLVPFNVESDSRSTS